MGKLESIRPVLNINWAIHHDEGEGQMKKRNIIYLFITSILFSMMLIVFPVKSLGSEGAVQTKGEVTLISGATTTNGSSTSTTKSFLPNTKGQSRKPVGRFPSTGELVQKSLTISGIVLLLLILTAYFLRRKKEQNESEKGSRSDE